MRVLVAEDERLMADAIAEGLRRRSIAVDVCYDGDAALERVSVYRYDVVILDRDLPKVHGDEVCKRIVAAGWESRVLMRAEGAVVSAEELLEKAWDENANPFTNAVRVAVMTLRRKLGRPPVIETVPGSGYRLGC